MPLPQKELSRDPMLAKLDQMHPLFYFNNVGVIHLAMKKYSMAAYYFTKAL